MIDVDRYIPFLKKHKLNQPQFLLMYLLHLQRFDLIEEYKQMFPTEDGSSIGTHSFNDLLTRGFIERTGETNTAISYRLTDKFIHIFIDKFECSEQLWKAYPSFIIREGKRYTLKLTDEDELRELYAKKINYSREEHDRVMEDLKYAVENNLIVGTIRNFVLSRQWNSIREERLNTNAEERQRFKRKAF